ncbi:MAG: HD domain-containing protein, partial [Candidatus Micrarchaeales archaeon]
MLHIRDAVVGNIQPTENELSLIEDENFQRLRHIKQTGFSSLVYTGANHTRFEHSLGTMLITRHMVEQISDEPIEELECVGLLHDIGHAAFSHAADTSLKKHLKMTHEQVGEEIIRKSSIKDKIQDSTLSFKKII